MTTSTLTMTGELPLVRSKKDASIQDSEEELDSGTTATSDLHHIPSFTDKHAERQWAKGHMAAAFRTFARLGYSDGASGHISLRDPVNPECFWISEYSDS